MYWYKLSQKKEEGRKTREGKTFSSQLVSYMMCKDLAVAIFHAVDVFKHKRI